jgi:hypothetical protein
MLRKTKRNSPQGFYRDDDDATTASFINNHKDPEMRKIFFRT